METLSGDIFTYLCTNFLGSEDVRSFTQARKTFNFWSKERRIWASLWDKRESNYFKPKSCVSFCDYRLYRKTGDRVWEFGCPLDHETLTLLASAHDIGLQSNKLARRLCDNNDSKLVKHLIEKHNLEPTFNNDYAMRLFCSHGNLEMVEYLENWMLPDMALLFSFGVRKGDKDLILKCLPFLPDSLLKITEYNYPSFCVVFPELVFRKVIDVDDLLKTMNGITLFKHLPQYVVEHFLVDERLNLGYLCEVIYLPSKKDQKEAFEIMLDVFSRREVFFWPNLEPKYTYRETSFVYKVCGLSWYYFGYSIKAIRFFDTVLTKRIDGKVRNIIEEHLSQNKNMDDWHYQNMMRKMLK